MIYTSTSIKEVIGRVIRNTRLQDSTYINDMREWIPEAMEIMKTRTTLSPVWKDVKIEFHKGKMPCGLRVLNAVVYCGCRMRHYNGTMRATVPPTAREKSGDSVFFTDPTVSRETVNGNTVLSPNILSDTLLLPEHESHTYYTELDWINTSFSDGWVRLFYKSIPLDDEGFPLVPDNESYKQAIYWYSRAMMIGAGFQDRVYREDVCMQRFEIYAERAISQISYPSVDQVETWMTNSTRLIMPDNMFESFFANSAREGMIG